jgi:hypothetical protein
VCERPYANQSLTHCFFKDCPGNPARYAEAMRRSADQPEPTVRANDDGGRAPAIFPAALASAPSAVLVELGAMHQVAASLALLTPDAAARVLAWAACHFGK